MQTPDVNVLVLAFRQDAAQHGVAFRALDLMVNGDAPFGLMSLVVSGFLRVVTHPGTAKHPLAKGEAMAFVDTLRGSPDATMIEPTEDHLERFLALVKSPGVHHNVIPDAYLAALALERDLEFVTFDRGFTRFSGLRLRLLA